MLCGNKVYEEGYAKILSLEKSLLIESKEQDFQRCASIHSNIYSHEIWAKPLVPGTRVHPDEYYSLSSESLTSVNFARKLNKLKFFDIDHISISNFNSKAKHFSNFLNFSLPNRANRVNISSTNLVKLKSSRFFIPEIRSSSKTIKAVFFNTFWFNRRQLKRVITSFRHVEILGLDYCKLSVPNAPDFSKALKNCQINNLSFWGSGHPKLNNWVNNLDEFKNLIQGFASSPDCRLSLKTVCIKRCGIEVNEAEQIFAENQLEGVEIFGDL
ncbi:unnamed protein product [Moneuplotes crassus]|uniref:Uncharacterized protein n=1 Tax=Euplotes crassus TaxID=5936 RepID=A0AAD1Y5Z8_EUPCR|nr:unnamed protein product [Moneuplotes crassus]